MTDVVEVEITLRIGETTVELTVPKISKNYLKFITPGMRTHLLTNAFYGVSHKEVTAAFEKAINSK